jgi:hypothetical protein
MKAKFLDLTPEEAEAARFDALDDPDRITLPGTGARRVIGLPEELDNLFGVYVQSSRSSTRDVTLSALYHPDDAQERKSECRAEGHSGARILPVSQFSPDPSRPNGYDRYCKKCRSKAAALRRKKKRSTSAAPSVPLTK